MEDVSTQQRRQSSNVTPPKLTKQVSVVLPIYNEEGVIARVIREIHQVMRATAYTYEIIAVDDGSRDRTLEAIQSITDIPTLRIVRHSRNQGVGAARKTGILHATGTYIAMADADGTYPLEDIPRLLDLLPQYDMAVGARQREAGSLPWLRIPAKWILLKLAAFIVEQPIPDLNSGLRVFKKAASLKFFGILPDSHSWVSTITLAFLSNGYAVAYIPISYYKRKGRSSFHPVRDTINYFKLINRTIMWFRPLRFFIPLTLGILLLGVSRFLYHALIVHHVPASDTMVILTGIIIGSVAMTADLDLKLNRIHFIKMEADGCVQTSGATILSRDSEFAQHPITI